MRSIYDQEMRDIQRDSIHMCNLASETLQDVMDAVRRRDLRLWSAFWNRTSASGPCAWRSTSA